MVLAVVSVPAIFALTITLPVVDDAQSEGTMALPMPNEEALGEGPYLEPVLLEVDEDPLMNPYVGEELHHLVDGGFSPLHSPLGRITHTNLRRSSEIGNERAIISKELLEEIDEEVALDFNKPLAAVQCVLGAMFCVSIVFSKCSRVGSGLRVR